MKGASSLANPSDGSGERAARGADDKGSARRQYVSPELVEYGTVAKLTQAGGQTVQDFFAWRRMSMCL